jgi:maltose alpha-D-glucosyltransferase/alpha-amylase
LVRAGGGALDRVDHGGDPERARIAEGWRDQASLAFLDAYRETAGTADSISGPLLGLFLLHKAFYEIAYEAASRPGWLSIPVRGALRLLDRTKETA